MIEVHESNKLTQLSLRLQLREILNSLKILWERVENLSINVMTKKIEFYDTEEAFPGIDDNAVHGETIENSWQVLELLLMRLAMKALSM